MDSDPNFHQFPLTVIVEVSRAMISLFVTSPIALTGIQFI
jgi:hypothetical protein